MSIHKALSLSAHGAVLISTANINWAITNLSTADNFLYYTHQLPLFTFVEKATTLPASPQKPAPTKAYGYPPIFALQKLPSRPGPEII